MIFQILRKEAGCIPMNFLSPRDPSLLAIGANGGCVRASSGYAFAFIQKQVQQIARDLAEGGSNHQNPCSAPYSRSLAGQGVFGCSEIPSRGCTGYFPADGKGIER